MRQGLPILDLAAEIERQAADAEIGVGIRDDNSHMSAWINLPGAQRCANAGVTAADNHQPRGIRGGSSVDADMPRLQTKAGSLVLLPECLVAAS